MPSFATSYCSAPVSYTHLMTRHCRFLPRVYWEWLSSFRFQPEKVSIHLDEDRHLNIEITDYLYKATLYEVPLLSIVSEIKNRSLGNVADMDGILCKLSEKVALSNRHQLYFSEFGTRRRFSFEVQDKVIAVSYTHLAAVQDGRHFPCRRPRHRRQGH